MTTVLDRLPAGARVALIRLRSLGDCVLTTPALDILYQSRPDLEIAMVAEDRFAAVFEGNPAVARILTPSAVAIAKFRPQLAVNLHGGSSSIRLTLASLAPIRAGFAHFTGQAAYNVAIPTAQEILRVDRTVHTAEHIASAMFYLGATRCEIPQSRLFVDSPVLRAQPYAVIHALASSEDKTWPAGRFLDVARFLNDDMGLQPVFLGGPGEDLSPFSEWPCHAGQSLTESKRLLAGATLFLGNDSGPAHMAAAFSVPAVVLFGPSDPVVWAPWRTEARQLIAQGPMTRISVDEVNAALSSIRVAP